MIDKLSELHKESLKKWDGKGVISFCHNPDSVGYSTVIIDNETNYNSTEFWCAMEVLDDLKVPRKEIGTNKEYSIVGRIKWLERKTHLVIGNYYYYAKCKRKMKCVAIGTSKDKEQSDFVDYKGNNYRFYNHDMYYTRVSGKKNNCS